MDYHPRGQRILQMLRKSNGLFEGKRSLPPLAHEEVVLLGRVPADSEDLVAKGFPVRHLNPEDIKEDISKLGVPFLLITTPKGDTVYAGGYSEKSVQDGSPIRDIEILKGLQGKGTVQNFPIFGCAVSRKLQKIVDPFSLKYSNQVNHEL